MIAGGVFSERRSLPKPNDESTCRARQDRELHMTMKCVLAAGALLASTSAFAQAAPPEQTSDDLVCQLSGTCAGSQANDSGSDVDTNTPTAVPGARVSGATRGFKIVNRVNAPEPPARAAARPQAQAAPGNRYVAPTPRRAYSAGKGVKTAAPVANAGLGRADLRVSFVTGSAELTEAGQREAMKFMDALRSPALNGMRFRIEGHTDAVGNRDYNLDLSRRRAQAVVDYLAGKGADRARFDVAGYGFDRPLAGTSASAAANRRVEVVRIK
jgi:OOP family OmpA-OmpF porin